METLWVLCILVQLLKEAIGAENGNRFQEKCQFPGQFAKINLHHRSGVYLCCKGQRWHYNADCKVYLQKCDLKTLHTSSVMTLLSIKWQTVIITLLSIHWQCDDTAIHPFPRRWCCWKISQTPSLQIQPDLTTNAENGGRIRFQERMLTLVCPSL